VTSLALVMLGFLAALPTSPVSFTPEHECSQWNRPVPEWWQGPVRYALTDEETKAYRALSTLSERAAFIARFWAARDPDPYTPGNPAEEIFWQRVSASDQLFQATTLAGWRTDRGRVYILLGPPDEITSYNFPSISEIDPTHVTQRFNSSGPEGLRLGQRGAAEWVYRSLPDRNAEAGQRVTFVRDEAGDFNLSGKLNPSFRYQVDEGLIRQSTTGTGRGLSGDALSAEAEKSYAFDRNMRAGDNLLAWGQAALFEKMDPSALGRGTVRAAEFFGVIPVRYRMIFLDGAGGTNALLTLGVPDLQSAGEPPPEELGIFGSLQKVDDPEQSYQFSAQRKVTGDVPTQTIQGVEHWLYEVRGVIPPGEYRISFGARIGAKVGNSADQVRVPDYTGENLAIAGPVLAEKLGELPKEEVGKAFALGQIKMVPKMESSYEPGSEFGFYFQIYHARNDPADGRIHLDIQYSIATREKGIYRPLGKPVLISDTSAPTHAYMVPLKSWVPGEYLLTVTGQDRIGGGVVTGTVAFRVR
jgi:GWxTD domain-containing protein